MKTLVTLIGTDGAQKTSGALMAWEGVAGRNACCWKRCEPRRGHRRGGEREVRSGAERWRAFANWWLICTMCRCSSSGACRGGGRRELVSLGEGGAGRGREG